MIDWTIIAPLLDAVAVSVVLLSVHAYIETFVNHKKAMAEANNSGATK